MEAFVSDELIKQCRETILVHTGANPGFVRDRLDITQAVMARGMKELLAFGRFLTYEERRRECIIVYATAEENAANVAQAESEYCTMIVYAAAKEEGR